MSNAPHFPIMNAAMPQHNQPQSALKGRGLEWWSGSLSVRCEGVRTPRHVGVRAGQVWAGVQGANIDRVWGNGLLCETDRPSPTFIIHREKRGEIGPWGPATPSCLLLPAFSPSACCWCPRYTARQQQHAPYQRAAHPVRTRAAATQICSWWGGVGRGGRGGGVYIEGTGWEGST